MFTGLVEEVGRVATCVKSGQAMKLIIQCKKVLNDLNIGDSISVNGVCLTATAFDDHSFTCDVMPETIERSNFGSLRPQAAVNLERAMAATDRFGGHIVQGHIDGTGRLIEKRPIQNAVLFRFQVSETLTHWMINKGSIAINGVSLTLVEAEEKTCAVSLIPHTLSVTQLDQIQIGEEVNIECDLVGKYIAKWAEPSTHNIKDKLQQAGFC